MSEPVPDLDRFAHWAFVCEASDCRFRGSPAVRDALARAVRGSGDGVNVAVVRTGCLGLCGAGPAVVAYPSGDIHLGVVPGDAPDLAKHLAAGAPLPRRAVRTPQWYHDRIRSRLGYAIQLLKLRARGQRADS